MDICFRSFRKRRLSLGQSLFEVVVALAVITIILVSLVTLATLSIRNATFSQNKTAATRIAQQSVEWLRGERDNDWQAFVTHAATPVWCMPTLSWTIQGNCGVGAGNYVAGTVMLREISFVVVDPNTVQTTVRVFWTDSQGGHESHTTTNFTNWRNQ